MYSEKRSVLQLVALLKAHGVTDIVLCPGSRNAPLIHSLATDNDFTCYSVVDERSAGFFALGMIQALQRPAAVCCTSGTAALNLGPAVAEAFYQELPLLVITADRPLSWIGQRDGQTIPQTDMFGKLVRHSVQLPEINAIGDRINSKKSSNNKSNNSYLNNNEPNYNEANHNKEEWYCNRLINEAILSLDNGVKGPTHINIPLSEPLFGFHEETLPDVRVIRRSKHKQALADEDRYLDRFQNYSKRMIIVGQLPPENGLSDLLKRVSEEQGVVVLADRLSNIPAEISFPYDVVLRSASEEQMQQLSPELVVSIGGHVVSKRLKQFIRHAPIQELWHVSPTGEIVDTFQQVTEVVKSEYKTFLNYLAEASSELNTGTECDINTEAATPSYRDRWRKNSEHVTLPKAGYSDLFATGELLKRLPENCSLHLANSNSVYLSQLYSISPTIHIFCNRGTNGIEGSLSTAVGYAAASKRTTFLVIGDLSFFYDMNALWNNHLSPTLRILINNNGGGGIFHTLPGLDRSEALKEFVSAEHSTEARTWAEQRGFAYLKAHDAEELEQQWPFFVNSRGDRPVLLEVFTSIEKNKEQITAYWQQQKSNYIMQPNQ